MEKFSLQIVFQCNFDFIFVDLNRYHPFEAARYNLLPLEDVLFLEKGIVSTSGQPGSTLLFRHGPGT